MGILNDLANMFTLGKGVKRIDVEKRFELLGRTGQGSMSKVWRARDRETGKTICLKVLDKEKTDNFEQRFVGLKRPHEGEICSPLRHPNIVQTYEHGLTTKNEQYLVMELVDGYGLNYLIENRHALLKGNRARLLIETCNALEYLHGQKYLHRDICPRNLMITKAGVTKLIDFGLTVPYTPDFCKPGNRTGTTHYIPPEVIKRASTDHRVDLFMLGVTAYELYTGQVPWGESDTVATRLRDMSQPAKDPRELIPTLDEKIARVLLKGIEREQKDRFQTPADFRKALTALPAS